MKKKKNSVGAPKKKKSELKKPVCIRLNDTQVKTIKKFGPSIQKGIDALIELLAGMESSKFLLNQNFELREQRTRLNSKIERLKQEINEAERLFSWAISEEEGICDVGLEAQIKVWLVTIHAN